MKTPNLLNAAKSACKVVKAVIKGDKLLLDEESVKQRLAACAKCEFYNAADEQCLVCTCWVPAKAMLATERCPKHKWTVTNR